MNKPDKNKETEILKKQLLKFLGRQDPKSLEIIGKLKEIGTKNKDKDLLSYVYYRYAYYYYFTVRDVHKFREAVLVAIKYLLRSGDMEYLGGTYNLVAYDAQDLGCYDVAYAYYMMAVRTSEQKEGIALPGLVEASAGRLLIELGDYKKGRSQLKSAIRRISKFTDMYVFNYNMILTYADIALASFLLKDLAGVRTVLKDIKKHYEIATEEEKGLSKTYYLLAGVYESLLSNDENSLEARLDELLDYWKFLDSGELHGLIFEIESLFGYMLEKDYINQASQILEITSSMLKEDNSSVALRYYTLKVLFYEKVHNFTKLRESLQVQYEIKRKQSADVVNTIRYSMEFTDMISEVAKERAKSEEEHLDLLIKANTDSLTGLPNRNAMNSYLQSKFEEAEREGTYFGIGIIDIDNFKQFNDMHGHRTGDECLKRLGKILLEYNKNPNLFCTRYGGDEFVVGYFGLTTEKIAKIKREMKKRALIEGENFANKTISISISQGSYNSIPDGKKKLWDYFTLADKKLYGIKKASRTL